MTPNIFLQMVALLLIATSMHTWAEDKITPYKVEAMIVVYTDAAGLDTEKWSTVLDEEATEITDEEPTDSLLSNQDKLLTQLATTALEPTQFEQEQQLLIKLQQGMEESGIAATLSRDPLTPVLDLEETSMIPNERRFTQEPGMKMIWHKAWIEPIQEESGTISHEMSLLTEGNPEVRVEGNFSLHVSRYLHVTTDFTVSHWSSEIDGLNTGDNANSVDSDASSQITKQGINAPNWLSQTGMTGNRTEQ
ncbi:MAG: CsiV family protein, partial [Oceanobacter sp.]